MGHKVHPAGFRIGVIRDWQAKWYSDKNYGEYLQEDLKLRRAIEKSYSEAGISLVEIDRRANEVAITIHTARPGIVIGRGGQRVDEMKHHLEDLIDKKIQLNIREIQQPELDANLVARSIADQIERRISHRRAIKQAIFRSIQAGAKGVRVSCAGRLGGHEIARREVLHEGQVPLHTLRADIDYGFTEARTALGRIGVKVWLYKGDILPEPKMLEEEPTSEIADELAEEVTEELPEVTVEEMSGSSTMEVSPDTEVSPDNVEPETATSEERDEEDVTTEESEISKDS
jgi:small subunit ribosomal protein S3